MTNDLQAVSHVFQSAANKMLKQGACAQETDKSITSRTLKTKLTWWRRLCANRFLIMPAQKRLYPCSSLIHWTAIIFGIIGLSICLSFQTSSQTWHSISRTCSGSWRNSKWRDFDGFMASGTLFLTKTNLAVFMQDPLKKRGLVCQTNGLNISMRMW